MDVNEFSKARSFLEKTQDELAGLLGISPKAIQSYEQGWRRIPGGIERQMLLLASLKSTSERKMQSCWKTTNCPQGWRENCIVWEYKVPHYCWFLNGTYCQGGIQAGWEQKMMVCRQCRAGLSQW
jgi:DNA-binding XRE family transcriptional regulator